ncbi:hypothetical protein [Streptomyces sp. NPDC057280]|uniref:hypothetical protein n=1 Tax=Streptomyces sp. NPDC057280 TaxID=3346081 RepID=UPI00362FB828
MTSDRISSDPTFSALVPDLSRLMTGRRCLMYNAAFDRGVLERELCRHFHSTARAQTWLSCRPSGRACGQLIDASTATSPSVAPTK